MNVVAPFAQVRTVNAVGPQPVEWDVALDQIAARLGAIAARDAQAVLPYSFCGTMGFVQGEGMAARFFHKLGASLLDRTICASASASAEALTATYGAKVGMHTHCFADSRLILIWGSNSVASNLHFWTHAQEARRRGATLVCIDPRRTETAEKCQQHIALLPGTDGALALGLMHELFAQNLLDPDCLDRHVQGWPALRERALQWPPERTAAVCGIEAGTVRELARHYGSTKPAAIRLNYGMQRVNGGGNATRLIALLPCLTGAWRHRGGGFLLSSSDWYRGAVDHAGLQRPDLLAGRRPRTINMTTIGDDLNRPTSAAFGPRIQALVVYNSNPVAIAPDSARVVADAPDLGVPDFVANHESVLATPDVAARYPLAMISPLSRPLMNSTFVNIQSLRAADPEPRLELHPDDAAARGIDHGMVVRVHNGRGTYLCKADIGPRARRGVVNGMGIWWRRFGIAGTNVNQLTSQRLTDMGRAPTFYDCLVQVERA